MDHGELLERMGETPALVRTSHPGTPGPQDWAHGIVLGHLVYVEQHVWLPRLHEMASVDLPVWEWWEPDGVDWEGLYGGRTCEDVADEFELARNATLAYLGALPDAGWARRGRHTVFGELAVAGLCEEVLAHDHEHLAQLRSTP